MPALKPAGITVIRNHCHTGEAKAELFIHLQSPLPEKKCGDGTAQRKKILMIAGTVPGSPFCWGQGLGVPALPAATSPTTLTLPLWLTPDLVTVFAL